MDDFIFSLCPPEESSGTSPQAHFFDTLSWQNNLNQAFGCQILYGQHLPTRTSFCISVFHAGIFRIGYLGFPVGCDRLPAEAIAALKNARYPVVIHLLRFSPSAFGKNPHLGLPAQCLPETAISHLQVWDIKQRPKLKRDINKANRSNIEILKAVSPCQAERSYQLYANTIRRHSGRLRYNAAYFKGLVELSKNTDSIDFLLAKKDGEIVGFIVFAMHGETAFYLHGAFEPRFQSYSVSDRLVHESIIRAKQKGALVFNLMASPANQPSLVKFKEKWGGMTRLQKNYTLELSSFYARLFRYALFIKSCGEKLLNLLPRGR